MQIQPLPDVYNQKWRKNSERAELAVWIPRPVGIHIEKKKKEK